MGQAAGERDEMRILLAVELAPALAARRVVMERIVQASPGEPLTGASPAKKRMLGALVAGSVHVG